VLTVTGLRKRYDVQDPSRPYALRDVSFDVADGEFFTLFGPSGCGKSTLLRCIAGLEQHQAGEIAIGETIVSSPAKKIRLKPEQRPIGLVFQSYAVWPHMTVFDNVAFPLVRGRAKIRSAQAKPVVENLLERVGLASFAASLATRLSGGQQQRLALARALAARPQVLLLDEPLSNLDAALRTSLRQELKQIQRESGITTVYVTHDQAEALSMSDRIAVLNEGRIRQIGTPRQVYFSPAEAFIARLVGAANIIEGVVAEVGRGALINSEIGLLRARTTLGHPVGAAVTCFVRPENVRISPRAGDAAAGQGAGAIAGTITAQEFAGGRQECTLAVGQMELHGWADPAAGLAGGDEVLVEFTGGGVMVLAAEPEARAENTHSRQPSGERVTTNE
jgi:iron(III) transport system ATP-binding protein